VSSKEQEQGFSPEAQRRSIESYCKLNQLYVDKDFTFHETASRWDKRVKFVKMLELAEQNRIKDIVFEKTDRAVREFNAAIKIESLIQTGVRFHFVRDNLIIDDNSPSSDKLRFYLQVILSKYYIDNLRDEINKGRFERIERGGIPARLPSVI